jgi:hypothetical protein
MTQFMPCQWRRITAQDAKAPRRHESDPLFFVIGIISAREKSILELLIGLLEVGQKIVVVVVVVVVVIVINRSSTDGRCSMSC